MQLLDTKIEYIDKETGDVHLRSYGLKDNIVANNARFKWMTHSSDRDIYSFEGQPTIITPILDHIINTESFDKWNEAQKPFGIGVIEKVVKNEKTGAYDFIWKVIDARAAEAAREGYFSRYKVSPAIWSENFTVDDNGVVHYKNYRGVHLAIVKKGAFDDDLAVVNPHVCIGGAKCVKELAAIASFSQSVINGEIKPEDPYYILQKNITPHIKPSSNDNLIYLSSNGKEVSYEEYYKLKTDHEQATNKLKDALEVNKTLSEDKTKAESRAKVAEDELNTRKTEDKKKEFTEFFTVLHGKDAEDKIKASVESAINRKYERKDLDELYGTIYEQKKTELDELAKKEKEDAEGGIHAGVGSSSSGSSGSTVSGKPSNAAVGSGRLEDNREAGDIARGLFRRRF
jgi:hypothetical protein